MSVWYKISLDKLTSIANAIRSKTGKTDKMLVSDFEAQILSISTGTTKLQTKTIIPTTTQQTVYPDNGFDGFSSVTVSAIPQTENIAQVVPFVLNSNITNGDFKLILNNSYAQTHRADDNFFIFFVPLFAPVSATGRISFGYSGNRQIATGGSTIYRAVFMGSNSSTSAGTWLQVNKLTTDGYNRALMVDANGNITMRLGSANSMAAGNYLMFMGLCKTA